MDEKEIRNLIKELGMFLASDGEHIAMPKCKKAIKMGPVITANREAILAILRKDKADKKAAIEERQRKIDSIEGLKELEALMDEWDKWFRALHRSYDDCTYRVPVKPAIEVAELAKKYPRAAAYIKAEAMSEARHFAKSSAGKKALERIINGEDYGEALRDAEAEWTKYCDDHVWD